MDLAAYLEERARLIDRELDRRLPADDVPPGDLHRAMRYPFEGGGKRIRPILMMAACEAVGGDAGRALPAACAMEMIHTASLIHDDLPAMDDDDLRRGRPTCHKVFGEALAILAGDALLTEAFILLSSPETIATLSPALVARLVHVLARASGSLGMAGGQAVDLASEGKEIDPATLDFIHTRKTGALILASIEMGALIGGADGASMEALLRHGRAVGLEFQIADDILDVIGDPELLGKATGVDAQRGKATFPALYGLEEAQRRAAELRDEALAALSIFGEAADPLRAIACYVVDRAV